MKKIYSFAKYCIWLLLAEENVSFYLYFTVALAEIAFLWGFFTSIAIPFTVLLGLSILNIIFCGLGKGCREGEKEELIFARAYTVIFALIIIVGFFFNWLANIILFGSALLITFLGIITRQFQAYGNLGYDCIKKWKKFFKVLNKLVLIVSQIILLVGPFVLFVVAVSLTNLPIWLKIVCPIVYAVLIPFIANFEDEFPTCNIFELAYDVTWDEEMQAVSESIEKFEAERNSEEYKSFFANYTSQGFTREQIWTIWDGYKGNLSKEQIASYAKLEFDSSMMRNFVSAYKAGLTEEQILRLINAGFSTRVTAEIIEGYSQGHTEEQIKTYANEEFCYQQIEEIKLGYASGLTVEQVKTYAISKYDWLQMRTIRNSYEKGLTIEQVAKFAKFENTCETMSAFCRGYIDGLTDGQIKSYIAYKNTKDFVHSQLNQIWEGYKNGLTIEQVDTYANAEFSYKKMQKKRIKLEKEFSK